MSKKETSDPAAEEQLLSRFYKDPTLLDGGAIVPDVFSVEGNKLHFEALVSMRLKGEKPCADMMAFAAPDLYVQASKLELRLLGGASAAALVEHLEKTRIRRKLALLHTQGHERVMESDNPAAEVEVLRAELNNIHKETSRLEVEDSRAPCLRIMENFEWRVENPGKVRGLKFGRPKCEAYLDGLKPGLLYVRGAASSVGKTADMCNDLLYFGHNKIPVHTTTMEMSKDELIERLICIEAKANTIRGSMAGGGHSEYDLQKISKAILTCSAWDHLHWLSAYRINIDEWALSVRSAKAKYGIRAAYLDYLQCLAPSKNSSKDSRAEQVSYAAYMCKEVAKELAIPVILLSQLKRGVSRWDGKQGKTIRVKPTMADLKESGDIENAADVVELLDRDREEEPAVLWRQIVKQRNGKTFDTFRHHYIDHCYAITEQ